MSIWVTSPAEAVRHGVFAIERNPPTSIQATGTGCVAIVGQFPWGPPQRAVDIVSAMDMINMFGPQGMDLTGQGYLALVGKSFPDLILVRIAGVDATKAVASLQDASSEPIIEVVAAYVGDQGNSIVCTVEEASNANPDHFNLIVSVTGPSGSTTDRFPNLNYSGTGDNSVPLFSDKLLVGAINVLTAGRPVNGTTAMAGGSNGTVTAADYVGSEFNKIGLALLESQPRVRHVCTDDPGNAFRLMVNTGVMNHVTLMGDRVGYINGDSGVTDVLAVGTDAARYASTRIVYGDPWVYINDDATGAEQLVPPAPFLASVASQLSPSTSIAWKHPGVKSMLSRIVRLEMERGRGIARNTASGVCSLIREETGGHAIEAGVLTIAPIEPSKRNLTRTRIGDYIATSFVTSVRSIVDSPNVEMNQIVLVGALQTFMDTLVANRSSDPNRLPHVVAYDIVDVAGSNPPSAIANGTFTIPLSVRTSAAMERIFLTIQFGENVTISTT
jgi:hypothetical protein